MFRSYGWQGLVRKQLDGLNEQANKGYVPPVIMAEGYARLGENNEALYWLEKLSPRATPVRSVTRSSRSGTDFVLTRDS